MNKDTLLEYINLYHGEHFEEAVNRFYADDIVFENPDDTFIGKQSIIDHFKDIRQGMKEIFTPLNILVEGDRVAAEFDVELLATEDKPDFPADPLKKGESIRRKIGAFYQTKGDIIYSVHVYRSGDRSS